MKKIIKYNFSYIIFTSNFDYNTGGSISLHYLCHLLNRLGYKAYLWVNKNETITTCQKFYTPTINTNDLDQFIVIYPEIISGNPLNAAHVVRWFLNKPGFFTKQIEYGLNEFYCYYKNVFNTYPSNNNIKNEKLMVYYHNKLYKQYNFERRSGTCYLMRKGIGREISHDLKNSIKIDDLEHEEIVKIFNQCEYFYSYDLYTAYSFFASICGCISIVVPQKELSATQWQPIEELRYGVAYGEHEKNYSIETRKKLIERIKNMKYETVDDVLNFIKKTQIFFLDTKKDKKTIENESLEPYAITYNEDTKVVVFGASKGFFITYDILNQKNLKVDYVCDNDLDKQTKMIGNYVIYKPEDILNSNNLTVVFISSMYVDEIVKQLSNYSNVIAIYRIHSFNSTEVLFSRVIKKSFINEVYTFFDANRENK